MKRNRTSTTTSRTHVIFCLVKTLNICFFFFRALLSSESKDKLSVNFMYEPPPGAKKEREKEDDEPEYKFEWQRKYNAPREEYVLNHTNLLV
jgi:hypothetical protein